MSGDESLSAAGCDWSQRQLRPINRHTVSLQERIRSSVDRIPRAATRQRFFLQGPGVTQAAREPSPVVLRIALATSADGLALSILKRRGRRSPGPIFCLRCLRCWQRQTAPLPRGFDAHVVDSPIRVS